jgi:hypothetical protein
MTEWLLRQLNVTDEFVSHLNEVHLDFQHPLLLTGGLVLLVPIAVFIWLRQKWNLVSAPPLLRFTLTATRVLILLMLVLVLGSPYLKLDHKSEKKPIVAVLIDHSQSMQLPYGEFGSEDELAQIANAAGYRSTSTAIDSDVRLALNRITRAKLAHSVLAAGARPFLEELAKKTDSKTGFDVQYYSFAKEVTRLGVDPAKPDLPEPPNPGGSGTWIGDAIGHVLDEAGDRQVAGILVLSDGQNNGGRSPAEAAQVAATRSTPIFTVPVGSAKRPKDVAITDLFTTGLVTVGDVARVAVTVESHGFDGRPVKVELKDGDKLLDSKEIILRAAEQQQVELTFKANEPGPRYLTVAVPKQNEEPEHLVANNTDTAFVRVSDEKIKVLLVEGLPRWDFRFLKNALRRDNGIGGRLGKEVDVRLEAEWRRQPPAEQAKALPRTLEHLAEYHTIILGDVSPKMIDSGFLDLLEKAVTERGVGLIVAAGPLAMPHQYDHRLQNLLPVRMRMDKTKSKPTNIPWFRLDLAPEGAINEATRFYDDPGRNQNAWSNLPRYYWYADAERAQPGATVLVHNPVLTSYGKVPLIAHHYAGKGKVLFVGTDETFRWRQNVGDRFFYKFWGQSVRFVSRRDAATEKKSRIEIRPVRAQPGEAAQVELMAFTPEGAPRGEPTQGVQVQGGGQATTAELTADPAVKGRYTGKFTPSQAGEYRVVYNPPGADPVEARLRVVVAPEELRQPNVNRPALEALAVRSRGPDDKPGQLVELPDIASIKDRLEGESKFTELHREASLWDNQLTLLVLIFLYSLDVGLRRLVGLS